MWQMAFLHDHAVKRLEAYFAPAIMAEKRQELSQRTQFVAVLEDSCSESSKKNSIFG